MNTAQQIAAVPPDVDRLIAVHRPGFSLDRPFYTDPEIYALDVERVWMRYWLYAGHVSQIPQPGSYFVYRIASESVIVIRDEQGVVRALNNVCTHRGSRIATQPCGQAKKLVCPYHQWVFGCDGSLRTPKLMPDDFDPAGYGLRRLHCHVLEGFIFISFAENPPDFAPLDSIYRPHLAMYDIPATRIAVTRRYEVRANWKLIGENFRECYHCGIGHPEYCRAISGANLLQSRERFECYRQQKLAEWETRGIPTYRALFDPGAWHYCERYPYEPGVFTQSLDGQPVAPLLGSLSDRDVGVFSIVQYPNFWLDVNNDHVWTMRITPLGPALCEAEATWLVREDAVEGRDYDLERLTAFWRTTAEQDWKLCEDNHSGVESRFYQPGRYATVEDGPNQFVLWYLDQLRRQD